MESRQGSHFEHLIEVKVRVLDDPKVNGKFFFKEKPFKTRELAENLE